MSYETERIWITKVGLRAACLVIVNDGRRWHRCGYVEVPEGHRLHGVDYNDPLPDVPREVAENAKIGKKSSILALTAGCDAADGDTIRRSADVIFDCHGGITYAGGGKGYPAKGAGWWFGFDCGHYDDGEIEPDPKWRSREGIVRSQEYVEAECEQLAEQIVAMFPLSNNIEGEA